MIQLDASDDRERWAATEDAKNRPPSYRRWQEEWNLDLDMSHTYFSRTITKASVALPHQNSKLSEFSCLGSEFVWFKGKLKVILWPFAITLKRNMGYVYTNKTNRSKAQEEGSKGLTKDLCKDGVGNQVVKVSYWSGGFSAFSESSLGAHLVRLWN